VTYAISLLSGTGGEADYALGHRVLRDGLKDEHAPDKLKGLSAAALGDSARLGRGEEADLSLPKLSTRWRSNLAREMRPIPSGFTGKTVGAAHVLPDRPRALHWYKRGGAASARCMARLGALTTK
jgi:uncharacterized protein